jgi:beta-mannanase
MKKFFYLLLISIFITGCSTPETKQVKTNTNAAQTTTASANVNTETTVNQPDAIVENNAKPEAEIAADTNTTKVRGTSVNKDSFQKLLEGKGKGPITEPDPIAPNVEERTVAVPDNSAVMVTMNDQGHPVEIRMFKNHQTLEKVEIIKADFKNPTIKVHLKNGKIINLPSGKVKDPLSAPAAEILRAAGAK